jgi:hypothetical protein
MRVLVVGTDTAESSASVQALRGAGHDIIRCHPPEDSAFPCAGLVGPGCPLEHGGADVAVLANQFGADVTSGPEDGARCALRRHVPLIATGIASSSPLVEWATDVARDPEELADVVARVGNAPMRRHEAVAEEMFRATLDLHGFQDVDAGVDVTRTAETVRVVLRPSAPVPHSIAEKASVRVAGAVAKLDPTAVRMSVAVADPEPQPS